MNMGTGACSICHPDHTARSDGDIARKRRRYLGGFDLDQGFDETAGLGEIAGSYVGYLVPACRRVGGFEQGSSSIGLKLPSLGM